MIYPKWLPRPKCWLRALELLIYNTPVMFLTGVFVRYYETYGFALFVGNESHIPYYLFGGIIATFFFSSLVFGLIYNFFWGKEDDEKLWKYFLPKSSFIEGCHMTLFSIVGYLGTVLILFPFMTEEKGYNIGYRLTAYREIHEFVWVITTVWIAIVAYCYHLKSSQFPTK